MGSINTTTLSNSATTSASVDAAKWYSVAKATRKHGHA
jgi:hypothetical protein